MYYVVDVWLIFQLYSVKFNQVTVSYGGEYEADTVKEYYVELCSRNVGQFLSYYMAQYPIQESTSSNLLLVFS
jgi:hypothetical protein